MRLKAIMVKPVTEVEILTAWALMVVVTFAAWAMGHVSLSTLGWAAGWPFIALLIILLTRFVRGSDSHGL